MLESQLKPARLRRIPRGVVWVAGGLLAFVLVLAALLSIRDWGFARGAVASMMAGKLDRDVRIEGELTAKLLTTRPTVRIGGLKIGNPHWVQEIEASRKEVADIEHLTLAINLRELFGGDVVVETLEVVNPKVALIRDREGRHSFNFTSVPAEQSGERERPVKLPAVRHFSLRGGELYVRDVLRELTFTGIVDASENSNRAAGEPFRLRGDGTLNNEPFQLLFRGGALANIKLAEPYEFYADVTAGRTQAQIDGRFERPFDLGRVAAKLNVSGENLAHLYYLTDLALPFTPPYRVSAAVQSADRIVVVRNLDGVVGKSDIQGAITVDLSHNKPKLIAQLNSRSFNLADLSPAFGKGVAEQEEGGVNDSKAPGEMPPDKFLPTYRFKFDRLRGMDAEFTFHADSVQTQKAPFTGVDIELTLRDSVLELKPVVFTLPQGRIAAHLHLNARGEVAKTRLDVRLVNVKLDQFKGKQATEAPLGGILQARTQLVGTGNSVHDFAASASGKITLVVPRGEVRQAFAELMGINVARGLGLLLAKDESQTPVRCGVATLSVKDGVADVDQMVFDTEPVLIKGDGTIDFETETLNLELDGAPKKLRLLRLRAPVTLTGKLRKPDVGVDKSDAAKQVGIAAALGGLFAPLTAALVFIDPGLAKDADCGALLAAAEKAGASRVAAK